MPVPPAATDPPGDAGRSAKLSDAPAAAEALTDTAPPASAASADLTPAPAAPTEGPTAPVSGPWTRANPPPPAPPPLTGTYAGQRGPLFDLAVRCALLSVVTLGIYRFWERTRIRRFIWAATRPGGDPFEYTGTGTEKLLGFLFAVIVLAVGLGLVQTALFFAGLSVFSDAGGAAEAGTHLLLAQGSLVLFLPLLFFAQYRARRYTLARTRWRGIRFGLAPGAWGYTWRGCLHLALTVLTLGLLWPRMTFALEKFRTDRTWFGSARLAQTGSWRMLLPSLRHLLIGLGLVAVSAGLPQLLSEPPGAVVALAVLGIGTGLIWLALGYVYYRVDSFRRLAAAKRLLQADGTEMPLRFGSDLPTRAVIRPVLLGGLVVLALGGAATAAVAGLLAGLLAGSGLAGEDGSGGGLTGIGPVEALTGFVGLLALMAVYGSLRLVFITQPIVAAVVATATVTDADALAGIAQRDRDAMADADGFANALDFGGPF